MVLLRSTPTTFRLAALAIVVSTSCVQSAQEEPTVVLRPGQNLQAFVARSPEGTRFSLEPGVYRRQTIRPKDRQQFIGQDGVVLNGAMQLTSWTREAGFWTSGLLPSPLHSRGECEDGRDLCTLREDLFFNGRLYRRVEFLDDLGPRKWYYENRRAYLADDPTGRSVELGVTPLAFGGDAQDVVLRDLIIEKYASNAQEGAIFIDEARGWLIANVTARWNHGAGLSFGPQTRVQGGSFSHNGQIGIVGSGEGARIQGVEIAFNNFAGYEPGWEAGGTKFWATSGLVVRNSCIHHNGGPGLWTDFDNIGTVYQGNIVFLNAKEGIKHEISYDATIRNNVVAANGRYKDNWLWGSQILIQNSSNAEVFRNLVEIPGNFGNGIGIVHQDRGAGAYGPWHAVRNTVHDNTIVHLGSHGQNGVVTDEDDDSYWSEAGNRFDRNTYVVAERETAYWTSHDENAAWDDLGELGFESNGELTVEQRAATARSCDR
jgi:Right handed beta helix region